MKIAGVIPDFLYSLREWLFPSLCMICEERIEEQKQICDACWQRATPGDISELNSLWLVRENADEVSFSGFFSAFYFDETIQKVIHFLKYEKRTRLAEEIIDQIFFGNAVQNRFKDCDLIIPVPLHKKRLKSRGYNQSALLARRIASHLRLPAGENILIRSKNTKSQTKLDAVDRLQNMKHAFSVIKINKIINKKILLVDDVLTTGVTVNECAKSLRKAGAEDVFVFTVARPF